MVTISKHADVNLFTSGFWSIHWCNLLGTLVYHTSHGHFGPYQDKIDHSLMFRIKWIMAMARWLTLFEYHYIQLNYSYQIRIKIVLPLINLRAPVDNTHATINQKILFFHAFSPSEYYDTFLYHM